MTPLPYITSQILASAPSWQGVIDALVAGHKLARARITDTVLERGDQRLLNRAAWIDGLGAAVKTVTIFPDNPRRPQPMPSVQGGCLLFDDQSGQPLAIVDSQLLTYWKTAADSVLGAKLLGLEEPGHLVIIGAGKVARSLIVAYSEMFPSLHKITVCARQAGSAASLIESVAIDNLTIDHLELQASDQPADVVPLADIVATATTSPTPVLWGEWLKPGAHVDLVGAYAADMRESDDITLLRGQLFVDSRETTISHIGELMIPIATGVIDADAVCGDFYDLLTGAPTGASAQLRGDRITVFKNGGGAHLDLMVADYLLGLVDEPRT